MMLLLVPLVPALAYLVWYVWKLADGLLGWEEGGTDGPPDEEPVTDPPLPQDPAWVSELEAWLSTQALVVAS